MAAEGIPIPAPPTMDDGESAEPVPRPRTTSPGLDKGNAKLLDTLDTYDGALCGELADAVSCAGCDDASCDGGCGSGCGYGAGYYFRSETLQWWTNGTRLPALLTTSLDGQGGGVLDDPDTAILWGDTRVNNRGRTSFRVTLGYWFDPCHNRGWEVDYFDLGLQPTSVATQCNGQDILARPFYDVVNENQSSQLICYPGLSLGEFGARSTHYFQSTGARLRRTLLTYTKCTPCADACGVGCDEGCGPGRLVEEGSTYRGQCDDLMGCGPSGGFAPGRLGAGTMFRLDAIVGYRYYRMSDNLGIRESLVITDTGTQVQVGTIFEINERFETKNVFYGGEIGLIARVDKGCWSFEALAKMAVGTNHQRVLIDGQTVVVVPNQDPATYRGGLLALPSNIGVYSRDKFAVIPQFGLEVGYQVTDCLRVHVGYDLLYWDDIVGAGDQIDFGVNPSQIPPGTLVGEARPAFQWNESHFWAQGIRVGGELRF